MVLKDLALLLSGFSVFSALLLMVIHGQPQRYPGQAIISGFVLLLLAALAYLQFSHFQYLSGQPAFVQVVLYRVVLFAIAPAFYLLIRSLLHSSVAVEAKQCLHFLPILAAPFLPLETAFLLAFLLGTLYLLWLLKALYELRQQREHFQVEFSLLLVTVLLAGLAVILVLAKPLTSSLLFFSAYSCLIGCAFAAIQLVLTYNPETSEKITEAAQATYAISTLKNINCEAALQRLDRLMETGKIYCDPKLSLSTLAEAVELSPHQLSELLNTQLGKSFPHYLRAYRVQTAQDLLIKEPDTSVLAISLSVGFKSQSGFYEAFRDITGTTPGHYRKMHQPSV